MMDICDLFSREQDTEAPVESRQLLPMMRWTERLQVGRLVAAAVDLRYDVVDVGRGTLAWARVTSTPPLARRVPQ
jgi:hypothetical protein